MAFNLPLVTQGAFAAKYLSVTPMSKDTTQQRYVAPASLTGIKLVYMNALSNNGNNQPGESSSYGGTIQLRAAVVVSGEPTQATFSGAGSITLKNQGVCTSDLVAVNIPKGATYYVRTEVTLVSGQGWPLNDWAPSGADTGETGSSADVLLSKSPLSLTKNRMGLILAPIGVLGQLATGTSSTLDTTHAALLIGDSILEGPASYPYVAGLAANVPLLNFGRSDEKLSDFMDPTKGLARRSFLAAVPTLLVEYGINDVRAGATASTMESEFQTLVSDFKAAGGKRIIVTSLLPFSYSASGFDFPESVYPAGGTTVRNEWHDYLAALTSSQLGLDYRFIDSATAVEYLFQGSNRWGKGIDAWTSDGLHPNPLGIQQILSAKQSQIVSAITAPFS